MNLRVMPFVRMVSKRCDQLQSLRLTAMNMIKVSERLGISGQDVERLLVFAQGVDDFMRIAMHVAVGCMFEGAGPESESQSESQGVLQFPGVAQRDDGTSPDSAG